MAQCRSLHLWCFWRIPCSFRYVCSCSLLRRCIKQGPIWLSHAHAQIWQWVFRSNNNISGLPQGSSSSPVLFNVYPVAFTAKKLDGKGQTLSLADDTLECWQENNKNKINYSMQSELNSIILVNPTKAIVNSSPWKTSVNTDTPVVRLQC